MTKTRSDSEDKKGGKKARLIGALQRKKMARGEGKKKKTTKKATPMPVTLLSGFLGSGKTSLMKHILQNKEGLRVAVIMNEITEVNLDVMALEGSKVLKQEEKLVEMANGCICCTLREDLLLQLRELARSGDFDAVLIESSGIAEPMQVAETFFVDLEDGNDVLHAEAPLDNCVTVIDASVMEEHMESLETIDKLDPTADTSAEGQQDIAELLFAQLEFANVVLLNKVDRLKEKKEKRLKAIVKKINPRAEVIATQHSRVPLKTILKTGNFTEDFAAGVSANWMDDITNGVKHTPETLEYGVSGFYWTAHRPFHPKRLYDWFVTYFALKQVGIIDQDDDMEEDAGDDDEEEEEEADEEEEEEIGQIEERKACLEKYGNLFRSKGFIWIGGERSKHVVSWQQAGSILSFEAAGFRSEDESDPPTQKLTFVGQHLKHDILKTDLEALLMTPAEIKAGKSLDDPFDVFPIPSHDHDDSEDDEKPPRRRRDTADDDTLPKKKKTKKATK